MHKDKGFASLVIVFVNNLNEFSEIHRFFSKLSFPLTYILYLAGFA